MEHEKSMVLEGGFYFQEKHGFRFDFSCGEGCGVCKNETRCTRQEKRDYEAKKQWEREQERKNSYSLSF